MVNYSGGSGAATLIDSKVLAAPAAGITINVTAGYKTLKGFYAVRGAKASDVVDLGITVNGDTGVNYKSQSILGNAASASSGGSSNAFGYLGVVAAATATASYMGGGEFSINRPDDAVFKILQGVGFGEGTTQYIKALGTMWMSTAAITSLTIGPIDGTNLVTGSSFALFGFK